jgi:hypothetical protein
VDLVVGRAGGGHRSHRAVCGLLRSPPFEHDDLEKRAGEAERDDRFGEGKQAKKVEATLAQDAEMGGYASQLNPMFQTEFSEGGSDSQIFLDDSGNDRARLPVLKSGRDREAAPLQVLQSPVVVSGQYEYGEAALDEGPLEVFEGVSGEGETDTDAADADGEESESVSIGKMTAPVAGRCGGW